MKHAPMAAAAVLVLLFAPMALSQVGVGGSAGVGGVGAGAAAGVGGVGVGASAGVGDSGAAAGASASAGGASAGVGIGSTSSGASGSSGSGPSGSASSDTVSVTTAAISPAGSAAAAISLPPPLRPSTGWLSALLHRPPAVPAISATAAISAEELSACRHTVAEAARPYGMVDTAIYGYGEPTRIDRGRRRAPVYVRIVYRREGGYETRQAPILCLFDEAGQVSGLSEITG